MEHLFFRFFHVIWRILTSRAFLRFWIVVGVICVFLAIFFGLPMTGSEFFSRIWVRVAVIVLILSPILGWYLFKFIRRRRKAKALEDSLVEAPVGDGEVLNERFSEALEKLKKTGGKNYLYELPWYVIIGPPGAGKTTALRYSGIDFPGQDALTEGAQGFGGTKNVDWWFAEQAVLIDTAGRYVMQESDANADKASWSAFLELLKKGRPDQPINGVILAFSVEDMLKGTPESLTQHAAVVRERLGEIHQALRIDFPVYVLFTKADLIAGFREYFSSFSQARRKMAWGTTFQTKDRREATHAQVGEEFDALLSRLSDEVVDRMVEEPDDTSRIQIFGLPGQMAMLRENVVEFLRKVFEPTRYDTNAILRGFYFTSGTQEGTPIDQVLGAMSRDGEGEGFQPAFMSGKGKSYFLHDVLAKVIFEERDWVNFDRRAVRRVAILRTLAFSVIGLATTAAMAAFGYSFWQNATLVRDAEAHAAVYLDSARNELDNSLIQDPDPTGVIDHLDALRNMPAGYGNPHNPTFWEGFGLNRSREIANSARKAYSDGLERMLRPRMMLHLENEIPQLIIDGDTEGTYRALKVYMQLGRDLEAKGDGDEAIRNYFDTEWQIMMPGATRFDERTKLMQHLDAMLELDTDQEVMVKPDDNIKGRARESIVNLPLADQAYAAIKEASSLSGVPDFNLVNRVSGNVNEVFRTTDGSPLDQLSVPGLYTFEGYWGFFVDEMVSAKERLEDEQWVLGETGDRVNFNTQLANLENELFSKYRREFTVAWNEMFEKLTIAKMSADSPNYTLLSYAASPTNSPIAELAEGVTEETNLMRLYDEIGGISETDAARLIASGGNAELGGALGSAAYDRIYSRSGVFTRVILESLGNRTKNQLRASSGGLAEDVDRRRVQRITDDFKDWHTLIKGERPNRPIDFMLQAYASVQENRSNAAFAPTPADDQMLGQALTALTRTNAGAPDVIARMNSAVATEFRTAAENATLAELTRALNDEVAQFCKTEIAPFYPFSGGSSRHLSPSIFGQFFGPGGKMDQFYSQHLAPYVIRTSDGLRADPGTAVGQRLSGSALAQFDRAQKIQRAFFASGSPTPEVNMSIKHVTSSPGVGLANLNIHGKTIPTQPDSTPAGFSWPGETAGVSIELIPTRIGNQATFEFSQGRWDIAKWLADGAPKVQGNVVTVRYTIRGQSITYRIEFDSSTVPFLMRELRDFSCPTSLE